MSARGGRLPVVAIVGRPNVGKSTLFNRLIGERKAIVGDRPGVTVDRLESDWHLGEGDEARSMTLVDTGGIGLSARALQVDGKAGDVDLQSAIEQQVDAALEVADLVLFITDGSAGVTPLDAMIAERLRRREMDLVLVVNKAENPDTAHDFYTLGLGDPLPVSALHNQGLKLFREVMLAALPEAGADEDDEVDLLARVAVIGRPNAGKSTLINAWLGRDRMVVNARPGTTRDAVDVDLPYHDKNYQGVVRLVDTAGQRRHSRINDAIEFIARVKAQQAFARADAVAMLIAGDEGISDQDMRLMSLAYEKGCALIVAVNKTDLLDDAGWDRLAERLDFRMRGLPDVTLLRVSATEGKGVRGLLRQCVAAAMRNQRSFTTGELNRWLEDAQQAQPAPSDDGAVVRMKYCTQIANSPPVIRIFCNRPKGVKTAYRRYMEREFRRCFQMQGVPVRLLLESTDNPYADKRDGQRSEERRRGRKSKDRR
ncbi:MAG: ribosome biogenesis GTPase Der [Mariprofundaceae bacterium]|nr:ribosome biogenesis GTPase Der [Mariprofundaceae bacterium]